MHFNKSKFNSAESIQTLSIRRMTIRIQSLSIRSHVLRFSILAWPTDAIDSLNPAAISRHLNATMSTSLRWTVNDSNRIHHEHNGK